MRLISVALVIALLFPAGFSFANTEEYGFAKACISGIVARKKIEDKTVSDLKEAGEDETATNMALMKASHRARLELQVAISALSPYVKSKSELIRNGAEGFIEFYKQLIQRYVDMGNTLELINNPENAKDSNFNVGELMNKVAKISAEVEYISESLFQATQIVALALVDQQPDKDGHMSYLALTSEERKDLVSELDNAFGEAIKDGARAGQNYTVASAGILRGFLAGQHKSGDERVKQ